MSKSPEDVLNHGACRTKLPKKFALFRKLIYSQRLMFHNRKKTLRSIILLLLASLVAAMNGCDQAIFQTQAFSQKRSLKVLALKEPLTRLRAGEGLEHDLIWHFAKANDLKLEWTWIDHPSQATNALRRGPFDVLLGRWSRETLEAQASDLLQSPAYEESALSILCSRTWVSKQDLSLWEQVLGLESDVVFSGTSTIENMSPRLALQAKDRSHLLEAALEEISFARKPHWTEKSSLELAGQIAKGKLDCFVTDQSTAQLLDLSFPWLHRVRDLSTKFSRTILFSPHQPQLAARYHQWFLHQNRQGLVAQLRHRYFDPLASLTEQDRLRFFRERVEILPHLKSHFLNAAQEFHLPWELIAAVAYQESKWDNEAISFTGVRGIMQLTQETAEQMGVQDRQSLTDSIRGGAKYLRLLLNQQPEELHPRERLALALAAYNVGLGHVRDIQKAASQEGRDPFSFYHLRKLFPLLSDSQNSTQFEFGGARGEEPVIFTDHVLAYYDLLSLKPSSIQ